MTELGGRIGRFVKAARSLLLVQAGVALLALALSVWAVFAVRQLAAERDQLQARLAELERQRGSAAPAAATPTAEMPPDANITTPAAPIVIPVPVPVAEPVLPVDTVAGATDPAQQPGTATPTPAPDCTGASANQPRCRPGGRWNPRPPGVQRPQQPVAPDPQQGNGQKPQVN